MIQNRVIVVWLIALGLLASIFVVQYGNPFRSQSQADADGHSAGGPRMLLPVDIDEIGALEVFHGGQLHRFERDAKDIWFYHGAHAKAQASHQHQSDPAAAARIDKALTGFGRTRLERQFPFDKNRDNYGVSAPQMIILVYARGGTQPLAQYAVGTIAPDGLSRYIMRMASGTVATIADFHIENLVGLVNAMQVGPQAGVANAPSAAPQPTIPETSKR
jgi:hypothetical protein